MKEINAVIFDAYGTLFDVHSVIEKCNSFYPDYGIQISTLWRKKQLEYTWLVSLMGRYDSFYNLTRKALIFTLKSFHLSFDDNQCEDILEQYYRLTPFPEVKEALEGIKGKRLAVLSNGNYEMLQAVVKNSGLNTLIPNIISVDEIKIFKPFLGVYQLGPAILEIPRDQTMFVSSNPWDIVGAKTFGYDTCWINRNDQQFDELGVSPDLIIGDLNGLLMHLDEINKR